VEAKGELPGRKHVARPLAAALMRARHDEQIVMGHKVARVARAHGEVNEDTLGCRYDPDNLCSEYQFGRNTW
jgi:hypothetical protein